MSHESTVFASADSLRLMHGVAYQGELERRRISNARMSFIIQNIILALVLFLDYAMGLSLFEYIAPEIGESQLSAAVLALIFPVAVIALHFLTQDEGGKKTETRLRILAGLGIFVFLLGASSLIAAIMFDGADGIGASFKSGTGIVSGDLLGSSQQSSSPLTSIPPILFFFAMGFGLILTFYVSHRLLMRLEDHYAIFSNASKRHIAVKEMMMEFDRLHKAHGKAKLRRSRLVKKLPRDLETQFARELSAAIHQQLHQHKISLRHFDGHQESDVVTGALVRRRNLPETIETREMGLQCIREIKDASRPFALLAALDAIPPKDEE